MWVLGVCLSAFPFAAFPSAPRKGLRCGVCRTRAAAALSEFRFWHRPCVGSGSSCHRFELQGSPL